MSEVGAVAGESSPWATAPSRRGRLVALGRVGLYVLLALASLLLLSALLKAATGRTLLDLADAGPAAALLRALVLLLALVVVPTVAMLRGSRERRARAGWSLPRWGLLLGLGVSTGLSLMSLMAAAFWATGVWSPSWSPRPAEALLRDGVLWALTWLAVALQEEGLDRGYVLAQLSRAAAFWPAALATSLWFMIGHAPGEGETAVGMISAGVIGLVLA